MADLCAMEFETGPFRANNSHRAAFGAASCKKPLEQQPSFLLHQGLQQQQQASTASGLTRYHSAPSSILASLLEDEGFLFNQREFRPLPSIEESEFGQLFSSNSSYDLSFSSNLCDRRPSDHSFEAKAAGPAVNVQMSLRYQQQQQQQHRHTQHHPQQQHHHQKQTFQQNQQQPVQAYHHDEQRTQQSVPAVMPLQHHQFNTAAPLPAILENSLDVPLDNFCSPSLPAPLEANHIKPPGMISQEDAVKQPDVGIKQCSSPAECNPVRQNSSPTDFLASITEDSDRRPAPAFSDIQKIVESMAAENSKANPFAQATTGEVESVPVRLVNHCKLEIGSSGSPPEILEGGLIRHSSSPAGLLSQWTSDGMSTISERMSTSASSGNSSEDGTFDRKGAGLSMLGNHRGGAWDDFGTRKRGRGNEAKLLYGTLQGSAECNALSNQCGLVSVTSLDRSSFDAVLCKARAKRGCATHPRSIAERVRRTKISERMRRLQELVPNMDKQTNTAEMLDEAVEYIKSLQRQVQELTENRPQCNGMCKQKGNASVDA